MVWRAKATQALKYPPVVFTGTQARAVGTGFGNAVRKFGFNIWACTILPVHVHLVLARHRYRVEQISNLLKGEATRQVKSEGLHPFNDRPKPDGKIPAIWEIGRWKVYLDSETAIENAIRYVEENPIKEGKPAQHWPFVTPFTGITRAGWTTYH